MDVTRHLLDVVVSARARGSSDDFVSLEAFMRFARSTTPHRMCNGFADGNYV
jgi:hypothetical protein